MSIECLDQSGQSLLINPLPRFQVPKKLLHLNPPQQFRFPLSQCRLENISLITHSTPQYLNKYVTEGSIPLRLVNYKSTICMIRDREVLIGSKKLKVEQVRCIAKSDHYLIIAYENKMLQILDCELKVLKQIPDFSVDPINEIAIVPISNDPNVFILVTTSGTDLTVRKIEKGFFKSWSCKLVKQVSTSISPFIYFVELPNTLKEKYLHNHYFNSTLFCCISLSEICIISVDTALHNTENFTTILFNKPYANSSHKCSASWGQGTLSSLKSNTLILSFSFGKQIYQLYPEFDSNNKLLWKSTQSILNNKNVVYCQYLHNYQLLTIHQDNSINLHYTKSIYQKDAVPNVISESYPGKLKPYLLPPHKVIKNHLATIFFELSTSEVYCLQTAAIGTYQLTPWTKMYQQLHQSNQIESAMKLLCSIYLKLNKYSFMFQGTEKEYLQLRGYIRKVVSEYLLAKLKKYNTMKEEDILVRIESEEWMKTELILPFETLIRSEDFEHLFEGFKKQIQEYISEKVFYRLLEIFITHGTIQYIPDEMIKKVFNYYLNNSQPHLVESLIINFDLELIEKGVLIHYCLENVLVSSLAYICTHKTSTDFITPFVKFYGMAEIYRLKDEIGKATVYAEHALWYIDLCMHKEMELKDSPEEIFWTLISTLTEHLFSENVLTTLAILKLEKYLSTLENYFTLQNSMFVTEYISLKNSPAIQSYINSYPSRVVLEQMLSLIQKSIQNSKSKLQSQESKDVYDRQFNMFLSRIVINKTVKFKKEKYVKLLEHLILNHKFIVFQNNYDEVPKSKEEINEKQQSDQVSEYLNKILVQSINEVKLEGSDLNTLSKLAQECKLVEVEVYIVYIDRRYGDAIDIYLKSNDQKVFEFILNTFKLLGLERRKSDTKLFQKEVKKRISSLVVLNPAEATNIAKIHFPESQDELILALEGKQSLQLQYLQNLISSKITISEKSTLLFTDLMCGLKPSNLLQYLKKYPIFPIQLTLKICQKHNIFDCLSYLYDKMGISNKSIQVSIKRIEQIRAQSPSFELYQSEEIQKIISNTKTLCLKNKSQQLWQQLFDSIDQLIAKSDNEEWKQFFENNNSRIFYELMINCSIEYCVNLFEGKYSTLKMTNRMKRVLLNFYRNYLYNENMMYYAIDYEKEIVRVREINCVNEMYKGSVTYLVCSNCDQSVDKSKSCLSFQCRHTYHKQCTIKDDRGNYYCLKCLDQEGDEILATNVLIKKSKPISNNKLIEQAKELKQQMLRKFSEEETEYQEHILDNQKEERVMKAREKLKDYENVRGAVDEISNNILQRLEFLQKIRQV